MPDFTANPFTIILTLALVSLLPILVSIGTAFLKFVVVFNLLKNAIGIQQIPPAIVVNGLALIIAMYIMAPVLAETYELAKGPGRLYRYAVYRVHAG